MAELAYHVSMDVLIFAGAFALGTVSAILAYRLGGRTWVSRFAIKGPLLPDGRRDKSAQFVPRSGLYGEIAALALVVLIAFLVNLVTERVGLSGIMKEYRTYAAILFAAVCTIVIVYEVYTCAKARKEGRGSLYVRRLARGYAPYTIYSIINFSGVIAVVALVAAQTYVYFLDYQTASEQLTALIGSLGVPDIPPESAMVQVEQIYGKVREGASFMVDQINTLVLLVFCSFGAQYAVKHTPVSQAFEPEALMQFDVLLWLSIGLIVVLAWSAHFFFYDGLFGAALTALEAKRSTISEGGWQMLERFNVLYLDLSQRRGLTGFMLALTNDRGGLLLALGAAGWIIDRRRERDARQSDRDAARAAALDFEAFKAELLSRGQR